MIEECAGSNVNENGCAARVSRGLIDGLFRSSQPVGVVRVAVAVADVVVPAAVVVVVMFATTSVPDAETECAPGLIDPVPPEKTKLSWVAPPLKMFAGAARKLVMEGGTTTLNDALSWTTFAGVLVTVVCSVYPVPALSMLKFAKLATPLKLVVWSSVPDRIPPAGLVPIAIAADAPGTRFRNWSFTVTSTAGVMCWPVVVVVGWTVNAAVAGAAALMSNAVLSSPGVPVTAACSL